MRPALAALGVLIFTFIWNDYFWALVLVQSDSVRPVTVGIQVLRGQWVASGILLALIDCLCTSSSYNVFYFTKTVYSRINFWCCQRIILQLRK